MFSTGIISRIPCLIDDLLLHVAYLSSGFGNAKMVTECEPKPISMNFGDPRRVEGGSCVEDMVQDIDWIGQKKKTILATISYLFWDLEDLYHTPAHMPMPAYQIFGQPLQILNLM